LAFDFINEQKIELNDLTIGADYYVAIPDRGKLQTAKIHIPAI
jgi:hypothetical protein